jgi:hypothetical protein
LLRLRLGQWPHTIGTLALALLNRLVNHPTQLASRTDMRRWRLIRITRLAYELRRPVIRQPAPWVFGRTIKELVERFPHQRPDPIFVDLDLAVAGQRLDLARPEHAEAGYGRQCSTDLLYDLLAGVDDGLIEECPAVLLLGAAATLSNSIDRNTVGFF